MVKFLDVTPFGYSQFVEVDLGNVKMILISGQLSIDEKGNSIHPDDFQKQVEQIYLNIEKILQKAGGTFHNVVKLNHYLIHISQLSEIKKIRDKFINTNQPPASTSIEVSKLFREDLLIEVEVTAIIPKDNLAQ